MALEKFRVGLTAGFMLLAGSVSSRAASDFNYEALVQLIQSKKIASIEELLPALPPDFRSRYVLMHDSGSLQPASYAQPRAILHNEDAKLILAFNGTPELYSGPAEKNSFHRLEVIQYRDDSARFEFREIEFKPGSAARFSEPNPRKCLECHGTDPRPNWDSYPEWKGAYASLHDVLEGEEKTEFYRHLDSWKKHPRYRFLESLESYDYFASGRRVAVGFSRNGAFNERLALLNFKRLARILRGTRDFDRYRFAILGAIWCADSRDLTSFRNGKDGKSGFFPSEVLTRELSAASGIHPPDVTGLGDPREDYTYPLRSLFESRGIDTSFWSMQIHNGYEFATPGIAQAEITEPLIAGVVGLGKWFSPKKIDGANEEFYRVLGFPEAFMVPLDSRETLCEGLRTESLRSLSQSRQPR